MTSKFSIDNRELLQRISSGEAVVGIDFGNLIVRELAAFRLAAMDSEPVAYIFKHPAGRLFWALTDESNKGQSDVMPVYAEPQPAPAFPDFDNVLESLDYEVRCNAWESEHVLKACQATYDVCRAAMLQAGNSPVTPDGYVMVPMRLTAENGAKGALSGEFSETKFVNCPECFGDDECETCDGSGRIEVTVPVTWTTIKEIWAKGVEHFSATPREVKGE